MSGLPPPPTNDATGSFAWLEWFRQLRAYISTTGSVPWSIIDFTGSTLSSIASRSHQVLQALQGGTSGEYYHLTSTQHTDLTDGGASTLHKHAHNNMDSPQGGTTNEYYHLTSGEYAGTSQSNIDASKLLGNTWASPEAIGTGTAAAGTFTDLTSTGNTVLGDAVGDTTKVSGALILAKDSGYGIKVDTTTPTYGWRDLLGRISIRGLAAAADPNPATYRGTLKQFQFAVNDECELEFHIPHDYVPGTDIYLHFHWSQILTTVTGGSVTWGAEVTYAKGHNQAAFITPITTTVVGNASTTQYQHMITEVQLSAASPSASQIDSDNLEADGLLLVRIYLSANNITVSGGAPPEPFLHFADIHYQSTSIGTKQKAPNFYV